MVFHNYKIQVSQLLKTLSQKEVRRKCETQSKKFKSLEEVQVSTQSLGKLKKFKKVKEVQVIRRSSSQQKKTVAVKQNWKENISTNRSTAWVRSL